MAKNTVTVTEILTAAGIKNITPSMEKLYTAMQMGAAGVLADIAEAAGVKGTSARVGMEGLVGSKLVERTEGTGTGKTRTPNTFVLASEKKAEKAPKAPKVEKVEKKDAPVSQAATASEPRYGKAMVQILDFMMKNAGTMFTVQELMANLDRPWYNATNKAAEALTMHDTGVKLVENAKTRTYVYEDATASQAK